MHSETHRVEWNRTLMREDQAAKGWNDIDLARAAEVHQTTVWRWFAGALNSPRLAKRLAKALGFSPRRYVLRAEHPTSSTSEAGAVS
jgi:ribosome-binding protein aMBF1 (putative translation factor)